MAIGEYQEVKSGNDFLKELKRETNYRIDEIKEFTKEKLTSFFSKLSTTKLEYAILVPLFAVYSVIKGCDYESSKEKLLPLAFSEITQIERLEETKDLDAPVMTEYLAKTNDLVMNIFESWNESYENFWPAVTKHNTIFGSRLEEHVDITFKRYNYDIPKLAEQIPKTAVLLEGEMANIKALSSNIKMANEYFDKAWDDSHIDETHVECHDETTTTTDSDGNTETETTTVCETKYDWTDNNYYYHKIYGNNASIKIDKILSWYPKIPLEIKLIPASSTGAENEYAIEKSRRNDDEYKNISPKEYLKFANTWLYGSGLYLDFNIMTGLYIKYGEDAFLWRSAKNTAKDTHIRTYDHSEPSPFEFDISEKALNHGIDLTRTIDDLTESVAFTKKEVPLLTKDINTYMSIMNGDIVGDLGDLKDKIMDRAKAIYKKNFPGGFNVEPAKYEMLLLWLLGGLAAGTAASFIADYSIDMINKKRGNDRNRKILSFKR